MKRAMLLAVLLIGSGCLVGCGDSPPSGGGQAGSGKGGGGGGGGGPVRAACQAEIGKLCAGEQRAGECLRKHEDALSDQCKTALANRTGGRQ